MNLSGPRISDPAAPLGVFDSGLGGLTVIVRLRQLLPRERIVYVADQAHVPYGGRDLNEVRGFAFGISAALMQYGCKALVMACNISTATALTAVQEAHPHNPVLGVIAPGARAAAAHTRNGRIGVLATEGTVRSGAYTRALSVLDPAIHVTEVPCPAFVPLIESERLDEASVLEATRQYLHPLRVAGVDTVILGCTHYPFLLPQLRSVGCDALFAEGFVDPAGQAVRDLAEALTSAQLLAGESDPHADLLLTTGNLAPFAAQCGRLLSADVSAVQYDSAQWSEGVLSLPERSDV